jgi:Flp pilus assembly secretin CpaC
MRRAVFAIPISLAALAVTGALAGAAWAAPIIAVYLDHSTRIPVSNAVGSVIVGDATVADAIVVDRHTVYVQGKAYGRTEVVVLDGAGRSVWQGEVAVVSPDQGRVTVMRGAQVQEMTCAGVCAAVKPSAAAAAAGSDKN